MSLLHVSIVSLVIFETKLYSDFLRDVYSLPYGCNMFTSAATVVASMWMYLQLL